MEELVHNESGKKIVRRYCSSPLTLKSALDLMDRSTGGVRFYVYTWATTHEFHMVTDRRHNIYKLKANTAETLEIIIRLIDRYRSQRKMAQHNLEAERRYRQAITERMERKRREGIA